MNCDLVRSLDADLTWNLINTDKLNSSTRRAKTIFKARDAVPLNQQWAIFLEFELILIQLSSAMCSNLGALV